MAMQSKSNDPDLSIIAEEIPSVRNHFLLSKCKIKNECIINETVDLTQMASPPVNDTVPSFKELRNQGPYQIHLSYQARNRNDISNQPYLNIVHPSNQTHNSQYRNTIPEIQVNRNRSSSNFLNGNSVANIGLISNGATSTSIIPKDTSMNMKQQNLVTIETELNECSKDFSLTNLSDMINFIQNRKGCTNISELQNINSVNMHEFLKSTPAESFSRKGFYSCAGCSSKFTSSEMYNFHLKRQIGEFSYDCSHCPKVIKTPNACQIVIHLLTNHKISTLAIDKVFFKSCLTLNEFHDEVNENFDETAKANLKKVVENFLNDWNVDLFNPYQRAPKDQRYFLLPMARKDVVQSHKFYSDHYRAANHKFKEYPVELLHCFMCDFVCENHNDLISHLQGNWPNSVTKCAFCTLSVPLNKEFLCAAKAHVLLHMGIFIMCPRCGFVPPPDLNPEEFEIALRLHLRYVCFHFNLIQIFICPYCGDSNSKAFNSANQVTMHVFDEHLSEIKSCSLCPTNNINQNEVAANHTDMIQHMIVTHNRTDSTTLWDECFSMGKKCTECSEVIAQRDTYFSHMMSNHKIHIIKGKSAFRCFGTCKRIHQSIDEFQNHRSECTECINVKNKLYQPHLSNISPESTSLCFCLYCGVGVRRKRLGNGEIETQSEPQMFANLTITHEHEQDHILCETNITACPWCPNRMSAKITEMTQHMESHLPENWFLSWYNKRAEAYKNNRSDIVYCYCYAAIDNPLSLHCHAIPQMLGSASSSSTSTKHLALTDSIHREFLTSPRHRVSGVCPMCTDSDMIANSIEMSWHIFFKHRNVLCYVCKNYRLTNADNSPKCRVTMWNHVYLCIRRHTPRFNMKTGLTLLESIANCESVMRDCTVCDLKKSNEISVGLFPELMDQEEQALSSGNTDLAKSVFSDYKYECGFCKETSIQSNFFSSRSLLNDHLKSCHGISGEAQSTNDFLCYICGLKFDSKAKWEDHTLADHSKGFRKIGLSLINPTAVVLDTTSTSYRCFLCNQRFDKRTSCAAHMKDKHNCEDNELNWGMLTDTSVVSDTSKRAKQSINSSKMCLSTYPSKRLKLESAAYPVDDCNNVFVCGICPFQCDARKAMIDHATSFHIKAPVKSLDNVGYHVCPDCALSFVSSKSLSIHLKLVHKISNPNKFLESLNL